MNKLINTLIVLACMLIVVPAAVMSGLRDLASLLQKRAVATAGVPSKQAPETHHRPATRSRQSPEAVAVPTTPHQSANLVIFSSPNSHDNMPEAGLFCRASGRVQSPDIHSWNALVERNLDGAASPPERPSGHVRPSVWH